MATTYNALVTYTDLTTMGLAAIGTPATGNQIATKAFIVSNYVVDLPYLAPFTNLQCPPYQYIISPRCFVPVGYVDEADLNASYNFEVCFDYYSCYIGDTTYCTIASGGFTLGGDCWQPLNGYLAYYYQYPGGPKVPASASYLDGYNPCGDTTTTSTTSSTTTQVPVPCGTTSTYGGGSAYPTPNTITLGSGTGTVTLTFDGQNVPDRFIVQWNGNYVIDTGYRGSATYNFGGANRNTFKTNLNGKVDPITGVTYPNTTYWPLDGYPAVINPGSGITTFSKTSSSPTTANVFVYAPIAGTQWEFRLSCPV